jgi:hypothetical protein
MLGTARVGGRRDGGRPRRPPFCSSVANTDYYQPAPLRQVRDGLADRDALLGDNGWSWFTALDRRDKTDLRNVRRNGKSGNVSG